MMRGAMFNELEITLPRYLVSSSQSSKGLSGSRHLCICVQWKLMHALPLPNRTIRSTPIDTPRDSDAEEGVHADSAPSPSHHLRPLHVCDSGTRGSQPCSTLL